MKKILPLLLIGVLLISGCGAAVSTRTGNIDNTMQTTVHFSDPVLSDQSTYLTIQENEATSYTGEPGNPVLPVYTKMFTFPFGTTITDVTFTASSMQITKVFKEIIPAAQRTPITGIQKGPTNKILIKNPDVYSSAERFPSNRLTYRVGAGLNGNEHVIIVSVQYYPVVYSPQQRTLSFTPDVQITVSYTLPQTPYSSPKENALLIITPEEFSSALQPLITHKNQYGIQTIVKTTESIAAQYPGRDIQEQIKYAIKDALEIDSTTFVMFVGNVEKIPLRHSFASMWQDDEDLITDMYYSDIYDAHGNFSSWDTNHNNNFGESSDVVDLYPDVHLGRLACDNVSDVNVVVDKIIHYETETYGSSWFNNMIFIGGNTFRWSPGNDGEDNNKVVMGIMSQFTPTTIWTSKMNYNRLTISKAITEGAGFLDYSGHGFEHGMGTYTPIGLRMKYYFTSYIKDLKNGYKLPIMFFDACLTAKLDYILQDTLNYSKIPMLPTIIKVLGINTSKRLPCYAWAFLTHEGGGAIATIGATRTAYGGIDSGAGKIALEFFSAYNTSHSLGEMITKMQNGYITDVHDDAFTVEEFLLLGDPSLMIGGYRQ
jgi:hypothetical protein